MLLNVDVCDLFTHYLGLKPITKENMHKVMGEVLEFFQQAIAEKVGMYAHPIIVETGLNVLLWALSQARNINPRFNVIVDLIAKSMDNKHVWNEYEYFYIQRDLEEIQSMAQSVLADPTATTGFPRVVHTKTHLVVPVREIEKEDALNIIKKTRCRFYERLQTNDWTPPFYVRDLTELLMAVTALKERDEEWGEDYRWSETYELLFTIEKAKVAVDMCWDMVHEKSKTIKQTGVKRKVEANADCPPPKVSK